MSFFARLMLARNTPSPHPEEGRGEGPTLPDGDRCTTSRYKTHSTANVFRKPWPLTPTLSPEGRGGRSSLCYACTALLLLAFAGLAHADTATDLRTAAEQAVRAQYGTAGSRVVIVPTPPGSRYPLGYWGRLGGVGREKTGINWSWNHRDLPRVDYYAKPVPERH